MVFDINPAPISDKDCYTLLKDLCMVIEDVIQCPDKCYNEFSIFGYHSCCNVVPDGRFHRRNPDGTVVHAEGCNRLRDFADDSSESSEHHYGCEHGYIWQALKETLYSGISSLFITSNSMGRHILRPIQFMS
jgi:hypothetical protein